MVSDFNWISGPAGRRRLPFVIRPLAGGLLGLVAACGCSGGPSRVEPPSIDASGAASEAMEMYDKDGDGAIAGAELDATPAIKASMSTVDADQDGKATEEEIAERIEAWQATDIGIMPLSCRVTMDGQPLAGAEIVFEPEPFLGDDIQAAMGETSVTGSAVATVPKEQRPSADTPAGLQLGLYHVRISKKAGGVETIPAKYNTETMLGQQIAPDDPAMMNQRLIFELKSK